MLFDYTSTVQHKFIFNVNVKVAETFLTLNTPCAFSKAVWEYS